MRWQLARTNADVLTSAVCGRRADAACVRETCALFTGWLAGAAALRFACARRLSWRRGCALGRRCRRRGLCGRRCRGFARRRCWLSCRRSRRSRNRRRLRWRRRRLRNCNRRSDEEGGGGRDKHTFHDCPSEANPPWPAHQRRHRALGFAAVPYDSASLRPALALLTARLCA